MAGEPLGHVANGIDRLRQRRHYLRLRHRALLRPAGAERHRRERGVDLGSERLQERLHHSGLRVRVYLLLAEEQPGGLESVEALVGGCAICARGEGGAPGCAEGGLGDGDRRERGHEGPEDRIQKGHLPDTKRDAHSAFIYLFQPSSACKDENEMASQRCALI